MTREEASLCRAALAHQAEISLAFGNKPAAIAYLLGELALAATPHNSTPSETIQDAQRRVILKRTIRAVRAMP